MTTHEEYFRHLMQRNRRAWFYRRLYLYPILSRFLYGYVLDIGCGIGDFIKFREYTIGIDNNPYCISYCRQLGLESYLVEGYRYPFNNEIFNGAIMDNVLEHIENPHMSLAETHRVLKKNGTLIVGVPGIKGYVCDPDHKHYFDEESLIRLLLQEGFRKQRVLHMPFKSSWLNKRISQYCIYGIFEKI